MLACPDVLTSGNINLSIAYNMIKKFKNSVFSSKVRAPKYLFAFHKRDLSRRPPLCQYKCELLIWRKISRTLFLPIHWRFPDTDKLFDFFSILAIFLCDQKSLNLAVKQRPACQGSWCDIRLLTQTIAYDQCWPLNLVTMPGIGMWQSYSTVVEVLLDG